MLKPIYIYLTRIYLFDLHDIHNPHILWPGFTSTPAAAAGLFAIGVIGTIGTGSRRASDVFPPGWAATLMEPIVFKCVGEASYLKCNLAIDYNNELN